METPEAWVYSCLNVAIQYFASCKIHLVPSHYYLRFPFQAISEFIGRFELSKLLNFDNCKCKLLFQSRPGRGSILLFGRIKLEELVLDLVLSIHLKCFNMYCKMLVKYWRCFDAWIKNSLVSPVSLNANLTNCQADYPFGELVQSKFLKWKPLNQQRSNFMQTWPFFRWIGVVFPKWSAGSHTCQDFGGEGGVFVEITQKYHHNVCNKQHLIYSYIYNINYTSVDYWWISDIEALSVCSKGRKISRGN